MSVAPDPAALLGVRVLLVEDHDDTRALMTEILEEAGAQVTGVPSGRAALEEIAADAFDVLVSDLMMPDGDGLWLIRRVRALESAVRDIPAVALTSAIDLDDRERAREAGYTSHVPKYLGPERIVQSVRSLARGSYSSK